jgi:hypothetical protein
VILSFDDFTTTRMSTGVWENQNVNSPSIKSTARLIAEVGDASSRDTANLRHLIIEGASCGRSRHHK